MGAAAIHSSTLSSSHPLALSYSLGSLESKGRDASKHGLHPIHLVCPSSTSCQAGLRVRGQLPGSCRPSGS
jgi:hypothetical protein